MKKQLYVLAGVVVAAAMILTACGTAATPTAAPVTQPTTAPVQPTEAPTAAPTAPAGKVLIRWSIGIGTGSAANQVPVENAVVDDFNKSQDKIYLVDEIIPNASARDTIATEIAAGAGPDIVGPVGWIGSNAFGGQWLDIAPYIQSTGYDTSKFEAALTKMYQTDTGTVGLPFAVYPSAIYFNPKLFDEAGLNPPPAKYGDQYKMPDGTMVDWSWDTLKKVAQMLTLDSNGKNATQDGFDVTKAVQFGFSFGWESHPNYWGSFWQSGAILQPGGSQGSYVAKIPDAWKAAWQWVYDGMWGAQPYIPNGATAGSAAFDSGNVFASGKIGMVDLPSWYLCCVGDLTKAKGTFEFAAMPTYNGKVGGRIDADTFRIWKGTKHPAEAFTVLAYLIDTGIQKLVVGTKDTPPAYGAVPSNSSLRGPWLDSQKAQYPFVKNWDTLLEGLNYADSPSAEGYMPNINEAWARIQTFGDLLTNTKGVDLAKEEATLETDLSVIFNK